MKTLTEQFIDNHLNELLNGEDLREKFDAYIGHPVKRFKEGEVYQDNKGNTLQVIKITEDLYQNRMMECLLNNSTFLFNIQQYKDTEMVMLSDLDIVFYAKN